MRGCTCHPECWDNVLVQVKEKVKSMLAAKSFEPVTDMAAMERWIALMAEELAARMAADYEENLRRPRNLIVHYRHAAPASRACSAGCMLAAGTVCVCCPAVRVGSVLGRLNPQLA